ncbi:SPOR domain-containing protein [Roseateles sp.]|uniref:SPOR domain-containing protein n=1 Tax=Roseateles sp. TaxID=1971397 RepID=UPI00286C12DB|nr:SPOR domain-containing protein [Roseateles sp.]
MSQRSSSSSNNKQGQRGGFVLGLIVGVLLGLAVALGVALYIAKVPIPFINKVPLRTAEQDVEEAMRNKNWDPNAPLAGKAGAKVASGVVGSAPAPAAAPAAEPTPTAAPATAAPAAVASAPTPKVADKAADKPSDKAADKKADAKAAAAAAANTAEPFIYFVQAGAFVKTEDAEQQRARLAMLGFSAKVLEREQSGRTVLRVRIGPLENRDEAEELQRKVEAAGIEANLVRVQR